jgi:hypothetical protein
MQFPVWSCCFISLESIYSLYHFLLGYLHYTRVFFKAREKFDILKAMDKYILPIRTNSKFVLTALMWTSSRNLIEILLVISEISHGNKRTWNPHFVLNLCTKCNYAVFT